MIGIVLTLVFGAVIFYLYNRLSMTERKMDAAPYSSTPSGHGVTMQEFEPTPEYLNAISGPFPIKENEVEDVTSSEEDYKQAMEKAMPNSSSETPYKSLQIDELAGVPVTATNAISVTKLSPDLDSMTLKELQSLAKQKGVTITAGSRRKAIIDMLKSSDGSENMVVQGTLLSEMPGPEPVGGASLE
jgi:hypothetical protein